MKLFRRYVGGAGVFAVILSILVFFAIFSSRSASPKGVGIIASFYPLAHIATEVGGEYVSVETILPPGGEPHDYEPSPRELAALSNSDLVIFNGGGFEPWVEKWKEGRRPNPFRTLNMVDELTKRDISLIARGKGVDPHIWLSPILYKKEIEVVRDRLVEIDPAHMDAYQKNADQMLASIDVLDQRFREGLQSCARQDVIVSHDAFRYLAREYGFSSISIAGISPDEEPSPKALTRITDIARAKGIAYVFFETNISPKLSETLAREIGAETLILNPLESLTLSEIQSGEDYHSIMEKNLSNLRKALVCP